MRMTLPFCICLCYICFTGAGMRPFHILPSGRISLCREKKYGQWAKGCLRESG